MANVFKTERPFDFFSYLSTGVFIELLLFLGFISLAFNKAPILTFTSFCFASIVLTQINVPLCYFPNKEIASNSLRL